MTGSNKLREEGDFFPSFLDQSPPEPALDQTPDRPKRSLTPRGHIFRDFGEAHRNITRNNRLKSNNPFATPPPHDSSNDIPLQDFSSPSLPDSNGKMLDNRMPRRPSDFVSPYPQRSDNGRSLTSNKQISRSSSICAPSEAFEDVSSLSSEDATCEATAKNQTTDVSKGTVGKIMGQHVEKGIRKRPSHGSLERDFFLALPKLRGPAQRGSQPAQSHSNSSYQRLYADENRLAGLPADNRHSKALLSTPTHNVSPNSSTLDVPEGDARIRTRPLSHEDITITESDPSFIDEDTLRYLRHGHRSLLPSPLRVPSDAHNVFADPIRKPDQTVEANSSFGSGSFFESHSDPFKYDSREYRAALQAAREREVSQALEVGVDTEYALTHPEPMPTGKNAVTIKNDDTTPTTRPHLGQSKGSFFDATTLDALRGHGPKPPCDESEIRMIVMTLAAQGHVLNNEEAQKHLFGSEAEKGSVTPARVPKEATKEGDWVTEATSEVEFDTGATAQSSNNHIIKATGSSVADVSDRESDGAPLRRFNSRNHILRHPPSDVNASSERCYPQANFAPLPPNMRPQISNPFTRRRSRYQRAEPSSYFSYARDRTKASKYDFRDSASSYGQVGAMGQAIGGTYDTLPSTSMGSINTNEVLELANAHNNAHDDQRQPDTQPQKPASGPDHNIEDAYFDPGERRQTVASASLPDNSNTPTGLTFPFPLLDLNEAQDLQRKQRESGATDETEDSTRRYERAMSGTSGRNVATPSQPQQPRRAYIHRDSNTRRYRRASTLSSNFAPPAWLASRDEFPDTPTSATGERGSGTPMTTYNTGSSKAPRFKWFTIGQLPRRPRLLPVDKSARRNGGHAVDEPSVGDVESAEANIDSPWGCQRRKQFFYMTLVLSILPFFGLMALHGSFNTLLASYTDGKVFRFTKKQRDTIKLMLVTEAVVYILIAIIVILVHVS
ncbi:hypothetical protein PG985_000739 [Apiospora marii]|uniref:uncharacterized protein n=1 Tax=Apiospora marii TaxID=335849 RepID=UPI00312F01CE